MQLPNHLAQRVAAWLESTNLKDLRIARQQLTQQYKTHQQPMLLRNSSQHLSYLASRMPATYGVTHSVLNHLRSYNLTVRSILDLGAGPGTASLAALDIFPQIAELTLVDRDSEFRLLALELLPQGDCSIGYEIENIESFSPQQHYDLVVCSYVLNELSQVSLEGVIAQAWDATAQILVLIEPGTPFGFSLLRRARHQLIEAGAHIVAPCTHHHECPLKRNDWCHFSAHIDRSPFHRLTKNAVLSYENEKYTYLIFSRHPLKRPSHRIIKRPIHRSGHVIFDLCGENGVHRTTVSKKHKAYYALVRKQMWGEGWDEKDD